MLTIDRWKTKFGGQLTRLVARLHENAAPLQLTIGPHVGVKRSKLFKHELAAVVRPATDIRPIEKFIPPEDLDGRAGVYRRPQSQCLLKATTDYAAVLACLRAKREPTLEQKERAAGRRTQRSSGIESPTDWLEHLSAMAELRRGMLPAYGAGSSAREPGLRSLLIR